LTTPKNPWHRNRLIRDGIYRALHDAMKENSAVYILGEGSHMKIHFDAPKIEEEFGHRVITLPISEDANSNFAVGLSLASLIPVVDVISSDFLYRTMDAICNTMAKAGTVGEKRTMIVRAEFMTGGPTSGQRIEALFTHIPGLRVAIPSNPLDAEGLMRAALTEKAVTVFFEDRMIEDSSIPERYRNATFANPVRGARLVRGGYLTDPTKADATIVSYGFTQRIIEDHFSDHYDLIDLRTLYPLDVETVLLSACHTNRLLIVEPDVQFMGIGAELAATVAERLPGCRIKRLGAPRMTIPASRELHDVIMPSISQIQAAMEALS